VLCNTFVDEDPAGEQFEELPCGWLYINGPDHRLGTRWYEDGVLLRRLVRQDVDQTLSLSPDGSGPTLKVTAHDSWWGLADGALAFHGNGVTISAPGPACSPTSPATTTSTATTTAFSAGWTTRQRLRPPAPPSPEAGRQRALPDGEHDDVRLVAAAGPVVADLRT
jgi:hypothetical protein